MKPPVQQSINVGGNRGHASIRSQASSRIFIGKVTENSNGYTLRKGEGESTLLEYKTNVGQYHACGVSKQSMGAVIWNVRWGDDSCFESHATQPRATLIDCCTGLFVHLLHRNSILSDSPCDLAFEQSLLLVSNA